MGLDQPHNSIVSKRKTLVLTLFAVILVVMGIGSYSLIHTYSRLKTITKTISDEKLLIEDLSLDKSRLNNLEKALEEELNRIQSQNFNLTEEDIQSVFQFVSALFPEQKLTLPSVRIITREEYFAELENNLTANKPEEKSITNLRIFLQAFGYLDARVTNDQLIKELLAGQSSSPSAFYTPTNKELTLIRGVSASKPYYLYNLAHEITHYFQDKKYGLHSSGNEKNLQTTDQLLAYMAYVEGQAQYVAQLYVDSQSGEFKRDLQAALTRERSAVTKQTATMQYNSDKNRFIYEEGFAYTLGDKSPFDLTEELNTPTTSKVLGREDMKRNSFTVNYASEGFTQTEEDTLGEGGCRLILHITNKAKELCKGVTTDRTHIYTSTENYRVVMAWKWSDTKTAAIKREQFSEIISVYSNKFAIESRGDTVIILITNESEIDLGTEIAKISVE